MGKRGLNKRAQLTIFVILGVVLFVAVIFLFGFYKPELNPFRKTFSSPVETISSCIEGAIIQSDKDFFNSPNLSLDTTLLYRYNQQTMPFLCYSTEFYSPCVPQNPLLIEAVRKNMENKVSREVSRCVLNLKEDFERKGYLFDYSNFSLSLVFRESDIFYSADMSIKISKGEESILVSTREGSIPSIIPAILRTTETIVNYESAFCEFNYLTWQAINRDISINRFRGGDQTKVYFLKDRNSDNEIKFAIRTCVMPAGI